MDRVLGFVTNLRVTSRELIGTVRLSRHNQRAVALTNDISDGATLGLSIGYAVMQWAERSNPQTGRRERVVIAWTVLEVSAVPIGTDPHATMRSDMSTENQTTQPASTGTINRRRRCRPSRFARETLRYARQSVVGLGNAQIIERALHTTSDFPLILGDAMGRSVRTAYAAVPSAIRPLARRVGAVDFRERHSLKLDGGFKLLPVNEHGEFKLGRLQESGESWKVDTFGRIAGITRQALVNDNLGAFNDLPRALGKAAADFEASFLADLVTRNLVMADGRPIFHADHGNVAASGTVISLAALTAARLAMRRQRDASGESPCVRRHRASCSTAGAG